MERSQTSKKGNFLGATLLIAGCCIGAGMLGLPVLSAPAGFGPSIFTLLACWSFMAVTGLLLLEVNLWFEEEVSIVSMAKRTLGWWGQAVSWGVFLFLFYSLMVAYVSGSGDLFADFFREITSWQIPEWAGSLAFVLFFGLLIYLGTQVVDRFNRFLMGGLVVSYLILIALGVFHVKLDFLSYQNWKASPFVIPAMIVSFGYHNLVPSLTAYLDRDVKKLRTAILLGSAIPFFIYFLWEAVILGIVPFEGAGGFKEALDHGDMATRALRAAVGNSWVVDIAQYFAFFAIITSLLAVALSFVDFLADGLHVKKNAWGKALLCALVMVPPFIFSLSYPKLFLTALNYAGGFGAVILFGILPALMVWNGRYRQKQGLPSVVPGGRFVLIAIILFSLFVICLQAFQVVG